MLALSLALPALAAGALPPGYEDEAWCPPGHCIRATPRPEGFAGPQSMFWECAHIETGEAAAAFWTGARVNAVPRPGWVKVKSFLDESFQTIDCGTSTAAVLSASSTEVAGAAYCKTHKALCAALMCPSSNYIFTSGNVSPL